MDYCHWFYHRYSSVLRNSLEIVHWCINITFAINFPFILGLNIRTFRICLSCSHAKINQRWCQCWLNFVARRPPGHMTSEWLHTEVDMRHYVESTSRRRHVPAGGTSLNLSSIFLYISFESRIYPMETVWSRSALSVRGAPVAQLLSGIGTGIVI